MKRRRPSHRRYRLGGALSKAQKATLCILAREAYDRVGIHTGDDLAEWRHAEQTAAVGKASLCDCVQDDFLPLKAHFLNLCGESGRAMNAHIRHQSEDKRVAMHKLEASCRERGLEMGYPAAICRTQYKCTLDEASAPQLWRLVYTVRNRRSTTPTGRRSA
jgi:hypothetical protein